MYLLLKILKFIVIFFTLEVVFAWGLSFFNIYSASLVSMFTWVVLLIFAAYLFKKRKSILKVLKHYNLEFRRVSTLRKFGITSVLAVWIIYFLYRTVFIYLSPAVNWDSLTYHLTKAANANQNGSWWFDPSVSVDRVNIFGSNSSILNGVSFALLGKDYIVELPQVIASVLIPIALFYIGVKIFRFSKFNSLIATISVLAIPLYLYESVTTQNDLVFTAIFFIAIVFVHNLYTKFNLTNLLITALSIALLVGIKHHGIIAGGILGLFAIVIFIKNFRNLRPKDLVKLLLIVPVLLVVGLPNNLIGSIHYDSFFYLDPADKRKFAPGITSIWANIKHFGEWFYLRSIGDPNYFSHDVGHTGLLHMVALPIFIFVFLKALFKKYLAQIYFFTVILGTLFTLFIIRSPDDWDLRLILFFPITVVFIATAFMLNQRIKILKVATAIVLIGAVLFNVILTVKFTEFAIVKASVKSIYNEGQPMTIGDYYLSRYMENIHYFEEDNKSKSSKVLLVSDNYFVIYPYFGDSWQNTIVYEELQDISNDALSETNWDYLVIYHNSQPENIREISSKELVYNKLTSDYYVDIYKNEVK